jgi:histidinol-phosphate/aromatic aminotransferase/cobyric acid decarboxylase-like protein
MVRLFKLVRTTAFLVVLCVSLATTAVSLGVWAVSLTAQVTTMTASAAAAAIAHRKAIAAAVLRTKAKARLRRALVVVPVAGMVSTPLPFTLVPSPTRPPARAQHRSIRPRRLSSTMPSTQLICLHCARSATSTPAS